MAEMKNHKHLYDLFNRFLDEFILNGNSILDNSPSILTETNINDCSKRFVDNFKEEKGKYQDKTKEQFKGAKDEVMILFAHANWLWSFSVNDMTSMGKRKSVEICLPEDKKLSKEFGSFDLFPELGSAGSYHKQNKYWEVVANLKIIKWVKADENLNTKEKIKDFIEEMALFAKYNETKTEDLSHEWKKDLREIKNSCAMFNILLYLCKPDRYERIASDNHKRIIIESFSSLLDDEKKSLDNDKQILAIRDQIKEYQSEDFDFYESDLRDLWNPHLSDEDYNEIQGLSFKKNIILYGPPGTGKTYTAKNLAKSFIWQKRIKDNKSTVKEYIEKKGDVSGRIKNLQLHSNYSYEDFIAGIHLTGGVTKVEPGYFLKLCDEIILDKDKSPYVLILDEINRIDLSRLFGEAFSAIENRYDEETGENEIDLSYKGFKLRVPENLYIIGTMNEIDFSLERLDFALSRRFIWFFYGFEPDSLRVIIDSKIKNTKIHKEEIELFIERATLLNKKIIDIEDLGKQYQIGHTFFADIIDIAYQFSGRKGYIKQLPLFPKGGPVEALWNISIEPMLNAFFGNFDETQKKDRLCEMRNILLDGK